MNSKEFIKALNHIVEEKGISKDVVFEAMEQALTTAYKKNFDSKTNVRVDINRETGEIKVFSYLVVVEDYLDGEEIVDEEGNITYTEPEINPDAQILLEDAVKIVPDIKVGETIEKEVTPADFGRVAASTAKQVVTQKIREAERNSIMEEFADKKIDVLVSTTVIEVGINVPNATVMMVENAERFGLAQLHQLRGRVGRGEFQSYCIFISTSEAKETMERLQILNHSNDGFHIASEDLKLRGPGDIFGIRQSGEFSFVLGDIYTDASLLKEASEAVDTLLCSDPELSSEDTLPLRQYFEEHRSANMVDFRTI